MKTQLELHLEAQRRAGEIRRKSKSRRAGWWFHQMRQLVDQAIDWDNLPEAPEQTMLNFPTQLKGKKAA